MGLKVGLLHQPTAVCGSQEAHSLRVVLEVLGLCQLVVLSCGILASQHKLFGGHHHLQSSRETPSSEETSAL